MSPEHLAELWQAIRFTRERTEGRSESQKSAVFREHFVDPEREGDTASYAKLDAAVFLDNLHADRRWRS